MPKAVRSHELIPSASRLMSTLRDVGYDFPTALADVIDNSIAADAQRVSVVMRFEGEQTRVRISDDGKGMDADTLTEAMRYGTQREYESVDLGKFGLGMKSASTSQCLRLTVASRTSAAQRRFHVRRWDLEKTLKSNEWKVEELDPNDCESFLISPLDKAPGTVVLWEKLDRVINFKIPEGEASRKSFHVLCEQTELHLRMVFHRFLAGTAKRKEPLSIEFNGMPIKPWDPFCVTEKATEQMTPKEFDLVTTDGAGTVRVRAFILPSQAKFSSPKAFDAASGPEKWNKQQGLYFYRNDRLLQAGGWSHIRAIDEHTKLARAAVDFPSSLDQAFKVDIAKGRVVIPPQLRDLLKPEVELLTKRARDVYDRADEKRNALQAALPAPPAPAAAVPVPARTEVTSAASTSTAEVRETAPAGRPASRTNVKAIERRSSTVLNELKRAALETGHSEALDAVLAHLKSHQPEVFNELSR